MNKRGGGESVRERWRLRGREEDGWIERETERDGDGEERGEGKGLGDVD